MAAKDPQSMVVSLAASHGTQLRRFLLARVRNVADVPDLLQEVYLRVLRIPDAESIRSPEAYLFTVAQHVVQQHALKLAVQLRSAETERLVDVEGGHSHLDPELEIQAHQCVERLQAALDQLSPKARATFLLSRRDGLSFDEIAARLAISRPMVKKYLMKALTQFRELLGEAE